jgi:predicted nucleic acid-binding protein
VRDVDDIPLVGCAIACEADAFVTGDKALLDLEQVDGLPVVSPRELWIRLARGG